MELRMTIKNVKSINELTFSFPLDNGLYAITGENSSGKSTLITCAASVFYNMPMNEYIGHPNSDASITFDMNGAVRQWVYTQGHWTKKSEAKMNINGFYEGSIIFGNRFRDTMFSKIKILDKLTIDDLEPADEFVRKNFGLILHDDENYYEKLYYVKHSVCTKSRLDGSPYVYCIHDKYVNQARMSTGENLLVSILHSLSLRRSKWTTHKDNPYIVFLDEIELALHASSLRRLVDLLTKFAEDYNLTIFFSTHSLELIRGIKPQNIYYLTRFPNGMINVTNPCYPAYATRNLYSDDGYGIDFVVFVEDDIAKSIVERIIYEKHLVTNARVKVIPTGGWTNTITLAYEVISSRLLLKDTKIIVILDRDIKKQVPGFKKNNPQYRSININYLPINSLEKYLKKNLIDSFNASLFALLDTYLFQKNPLNSLLQKYSKSGDSDTDTDGKRLYGILIDELRGMRKGRDDLVEMVMKYIIDNEQDSLDELSSFLTEQLK